MAPTYFISDLHLFSKRSRHEMYLDSLESAVDRAGCMVLGGDIFDFRWSMLPSFHATLDAAETWVEQLVERRPDCEFHYILGNHDSHPRFVQRLKHLSDRHENLTWHHEYLRRNSDVFLHGDILDGPITSQALAKRRQRWAHEAVRGPLSNAMYDAAIAVRAHKVVGRMAHPHQRTARRLIRYLDHVGHGPHTGVNRVYFGHTHAALDAFRYSQISFHNGGAPMAGLEFRVLEVAPSASSTPAAPAVTRVTVTGDSAPVPPAPRRVLG
jgi:UDP-2,3-diacylglucosamine pyrophosphatase LpxH